MKVLQSPNYNKKRKIVVNQEELERALKPDIMYENEDIKEE